MDLLAVQGTLKSLLQHHSSKASMLRRSGFFIVQLSHPCMTTGKTITLMRQTFVGKATSLPLLAVLVAWMISLGSAWGISKETTVMHSFSLRSVSLPCPSLAQPALLFVPHICTPCLAPWGAPLTPPAYALPGEVSPRRSWVETAQGHGDGGPKGPSAA